VPHARQPITAPLSRRRGNVYVTAEIERSALMAGAASVVLFPFARGFLDGEIDRLEERLAPQKKREDVGGRQFV
jgi:hypothetical protein